MIIKFLDTEKKFSEKSNSVTFVASTESPDRYGDIISVRGWKLDSYKKNPIIILNHDSSSLPIAKGKVHIKNNQLLVDVEFDMDDPTAAKVARKVKAGFINAVSVGFLPIEATPRKDMDSDSPLYAKRGLYFESAELLEVSIVTIPANSEATMLEKNLLNETYIRSIVKSEMEYSMTLHKHILNVEETEDTIIITYAKPLEEDEEQEEVQEVELDEEDEDTEEMAYKEEDKEEDPKDNKSYFDGISKYIATLL